MIGRFSCPGFAADFCEAFGPVHHGQTKLCALNGHGEFLETCEAAGLLEVPGFRTLSGMSISHAAFAGALLSLMRGCPFAGGVIASLPAAAIVGFLAERPGFSPDYRHGRHFFLCHGPRRDDPRAYAGSVHGRAFPCLGEPPCR